MATATAYAPGMDRSLNYDAAETVGFFVLAPSAFDALRLQRSFNNHPLFSFLEALVVQVTGRSDEWVLRILPIGFAALAVGYLVWAVHRRWGRSAALAAGVVLASNPMFVEHGRSVRGYSLLVLASIVSTDLYLRAVDDPHDQNLRTGYLVASTIGMLTHLFMAPVLLIHGVDLLRRRCLDRRWLVTIGSLGALCALFYARTMDDLLGEGDRRGRWFQADFPLDLGIELLGHGLLTVALLGPLAVVGFRRLESSSASTFASVATALVLLVWVLAPQNLSPRFLLWLVPGTAVLIASAMRGHQPTIRSVMVAVAVASAAFGMRSDYTESRNAYRETAAILEREAREGAATCVADLSVPPMLAYTRAFEALTDTGMLKRCDVLAVPEPALDVDIVRAARASFEFVVEFEREDPGVVFSRTPLPIVSE